MGATKNYKLEVLTLPGSDLNLIGDIVDQYKNPIGLGFTRCESHLTYDANHNKNIMVDQHQWTFDMDCEKARELEGALNDEPTVFRFLLVENINYK